MIIATSPIPTCCRSNSSRATSMNWRRICRNCRTRKRRVSWRNMASRPMTRACWCWSALPPIISRTPPRGVISKLVANWVINELFGRLNKESQSIETSPVSAAQIGGIVDLISSNVISGKLAKDLFEIVWTEGGDPAKIVEARGMKQVTDTGAIEKAVDEIIAANPDKVAQAQAKPTMLGWFVGQVMKGTGGKANPQAVNEILKSKLGI